MVESTLKTPLPSPALASGFRFTAALLLIAVSFLCVSVSTLFFNARMPSPRFEIRSLNLLERKDENTRPSVIKPRKRVICIDPGHPSEVNSGLIVQNGTTETHIDWAVSKRLEKILSAKGFRVVLTKRSEKALVRNKARAMIANRAHADVMVRLHCDTGRGEGYAIYYPDRTGTIDKVTGPGRDIRETSKKYADIISDQMSVVLKDDLKNNGVLGDSKTFVGGKQGALTGSVFSKVPVLTIEMVTLSRSEDAEFIKSEAGQASMAEAIASGVEAIFAGD